MGRQAKFGNELRGSFAKAAMDPSARLEGRYVEVDYSADCLAPVKTYSMSRAVQPETLSIEGGTDRTLARGQRGYEIVRWVRCRKCDNCGKAAAKHWAVRINTEIDLSFRTWWVTFTASPESHLLWQFRGVDMGDEITRAFKRARSRGFQFRYIVVREKHKSGLPHFHAFIHEHGDPIRKRDLAGRPDDWPKMTPDEEKADRWFWPFGFVHMRLTGNEERRVRPYYITKYIRKDPQGRIRASLRYGKP